MGANILKGGDIPRVFAPLLRRGGANLLGATFLKFYLAPPPKYEFAPQMPPQILRPGAATEFLLRHFDCILNINFAVGGKRSD
jgi:hypothetical protein